MVRDELDNVNLVQSAFFAATVLSPHIAHSSAKNTYDEWLEQLIYAQKKAEYSPAVFKSRKDKLKDYAAHAVQLLEVLSKSKVVELFDKKATEMYTSLQQNNE